MTLLGNSNLVNIFEVIFNTLCGLITSNRLDTASRCPWLAYSYNLLIYEKNKFEYDDFFSISENKNVSTVLFKITSIVAIIPMIKSSFLKATIIKHTSWY